jgi:hypothetical protein
MPAGSAAKIAEVLFMCNHHPAAYSRPCSSYQSSLKSVVDCRVLTEISKG